jgi:hypothetical protein
MDEACCGDSNKPKFIKNESGCKSYNRFRIDVFSQAGNSTPEAGISGVGNSAKSFFLSCGATRSRGAEILNPS